MPTARPIIVTQDKEFRDGRTLLVCGVGPDVRGWLFAVTDPLRSPARVEEIDHLNTSGVVGVGEYVYRILSSSSAENATADLLIYDAQGVTAYRRLSGLADPHGLISDGQHLVVPCSFTNEIRWLTLGGDTARIWRAPGVGDAWHINGVHTHDGRLFASAFGIFDKHRGWRDAFDRQTGIIFDVATQQPVVSGLSCPHDPLFVDGHWLVCDSYTNRLLAIDQHTGNIFHSLDLHGWTRGVAVTESHFFVGVSGTRHGVTTKYAQVAVVDRRDWQVVSRIDLPCYEISALALVDPSTVPGLRRGFRTNELRVAVADRRNLLEAAGQKAEAPAFTPMDALSRPKDFRVRIWVKAPRNVPCGQLFTVDITIKNRGRTTLFTAAPFPINIGVVFGQVGDPAEETQRMALPEPIPAGKTLRFKLGVRAPSVPGRYRVRFTLIQEWVRWFDNDQRWRARMLSFNRRIVRATVSSCSGQG